MSQYALKNLVNCLSDEENLIHSLPTLISCLLCVKDDEAEPALLAKVHARISTLLQSKLVRLRWCGVCLAKAALTREYGKWNTLTSHGATWTKLLLKVLENEPVEVLIEREVTVVAFVLELTRGKPSLTRDLTTPSLPTFLNHVFSHLGKQISPELSKCLLFHAQRIMIYHSTTFRPFANKLQAYTTGLLNGSCVESEQVELAARAFASLHVCAPKNSSSDQWLAGFLAVIGECHATLSYIFSVVVEDQQYSQMPLMNMLKFSSDFISQTPLAMRRLDSLGRTVMAFINLSTKEKVKVPLGQISKLIIRMLDVTPHSSIKASTPQTTQLALISVIPQIHHLAADMARTTYNIFGTQAYMHATSIQPLLLRDATSIDSDCQISVFRALSASVRTYGFLNIEHDTNTLIKIYQLCVRKISSIVPDLATKLVTDTLSNGTSHISKKRKHGNQGVSDQISNSSSFHSKPSEALIDASIEVLKAILENTHGIISKGNRQQLELIVLRLLTTEDANSLDSLSTKGLLNLVKVFLTAPDAGVSSASLLSTGLRVVERYSAHSDPSIKTAALQVQEHLELLIHPRFPATRRFLPPHEKQAVKEETPPSMIDEDLEEEVVEIVEETEDAQRRNQEILEERKPQSQLPTFVPYAEEVPASIESPQMPLPTPATEKLLSEQFAVEEAELAKEAEQIKEPEGEVKDRKRTKLSSSPRPVVATYNPISQGDISSDDESVELCLDSPTDVEDNDEEDEGDK